MTLKRKLLAIISLLAITTVLLMVGVWALKTIDFSIGGNISFSASGINAIISKGVLANGTLEDATNKMKEVVLNTDKTQAQLEQEFLSWQKLELSFNEEADDVTISFSITNTATNPEHYISVNVNVNGGSMKNATISINKSSALLSPNGGSQNFVITFSVTDKTANASLTGFEINFNMQYALLTDESNSYFTFSYNDDTTPLTASVTGFDKSVTSVEIPAIIKHNEKVYMVTSIGDSAFDYCNGLKSIEIPNSVISIGNSAFYYCSKLTSVTIPNGVTSIGDYAFSSCYELTSIEIPNSVTRIGTGAFNSCNKLTGQLVIPNSVTSIGDRAFSSCSGLTSISVDGSNKFYDSRDNCNAIIEKSSNTLIAGCKNSVIPNGVTSIGSSAFNGCSGLTSIEIPNSVTSIGSSAFSSCKLTSIEIPNSVTSIGDDAFWGCVELTSIEIPDSVTSIGDEAFWSCWGLSSVTIGNGVTSIGDKAFTSCSGLTSISVDSLNTVYDSRENCNAIIETSNNTLVVGCENSVIPYGVTSIGNGAFFGSGLESIEIPDSVTSIGDEAFEDCHRLTSIEIPYSVTSIGIEAFFMCNSLTSVTIGSGFPFIEDLIIGDGAFRECWELETVVIDSETVASGLTNIESQGYLIQIATKIYIKSEIVEAGNIGSYVTNTSNFTVGTSDKTGYVLYNRVV